MSDIWWRALDEEAVGYLTVGICAGFTAIVRPFGLDGVLLVLVGMVIATVCGLVAAGARYLLGEVVRRW